MPDRQRLDLVERHQLILIGRSFLLVFVRPSLVCPWRISDNHLVPEHPEVPEGPAAHLRSLSARLRMRAHSRHSPSLVTVSAVRRWPRTHFSFGIAGTSSMSGNSITTRLAHAGWP